MTATECEIDFKAFCDKDVGYRYALDQPFVKDGFKVATDCRIMLTIPTGEPDSEDVPNKRRPNAKIVIDRAQSVPSTYAWPGEFTDCPKCGQLGILPAELVGSAIECRTCKGTGMQECDLGHEHDCEDCKSSGYVNQRMPEKFEPQPCEDCIIKFGNKSFHRQYIHKISQLPKPLFYGLKDDMLVVRGSGGLMVILISLRDD